MNDIFFSENYAFEVFKRSHVNVDWNKGPCTGMHNGKFIINRNTPWEKDIEVIRMNTFPK